MSRCTRVAQSSVYGVGLGCICRSNSPPSAKNEAPHHTLHALSVLSCFLSFSQFEEGFYRATGMACPRTKKFVCPFTDNISAQRFKPSRKKRLMLHAEYFRNREMDFFCLGTILLMLREYIKTTPPNCLQTLVKRISRQKVVGTGKIFWIQVEVLRIQAKVLGYVRIRGGYRYFIMDTVFVHRSRLPNDFSIFLTRLSKVHIYFSSDLPSLSLPNAISRSFPRVFLSRNSHPRPT